MPLHEFVQATANANGRAEGSTGPDKYGDQWEITLINTNTTSTAQTELRVYRGVESDTTRILGTYSANSDTAGGGTGITVRAGEKLVFVWSNADVGAICTARIEGDFISGRR
jgi:hypothetical protein